MSDREDRRNNSGERGGFSRSERARGASGDRRGPRSNDRAPQDRPGRGGEDRVRERPEWETRVARPDRERPKSPMIPEEITEKDLDLMVRVQMKTLSPENAERVARHLAMVNLLIDADPELAHKHAIAAADRAGRIAVVRETLGVTAYTVGDFALALRELQAFRRMSGSNDQLPLMVDSERGLGRPDKALELGRSVPSDKLSAGVRANLAIAMSGARLDKGQNDLALAELEIAELNPAKVFDYSPQLFRAYANTLEILGRDADAKKWFDLADRADVALEAQKRGPEEYLDVVEEIPIPEPYESKKPKFDEDRPRRDDRGRDDRGRSDRSRDDRPRRDFSDRPRRDSSDRPARRDDSAKPSGEKPAWKKRNE
ncbi:MAG: hypothetical protein ACKOWE_03555 [Micrococcales bacterium]